MNHDNTHNGEYAYTGAVNYDANDVSSEDLHSTEQENTHHLVFADSSHVEVEHVANREREDDNVCDNIDRPALIRSFHELDMGYPHPRIIYGTRRCMHFPGSPVQRVDSGMHSSAATSMRATL